MAYPEDDGAHLADDTDSIEKELVQYEDAARVTEALLKLSPHAREILLLRYQAGLSFEEASDVLGLSINTVKSRGRRALLELKPYLLHPGGTEGRMHS
jgi:RNA polymerase sigma-70 factor (ECF subfamily)